MDTLHTSQSLHDRLQLAVQGLSYRKLGALTETHPETVRRYMNGHAPSAAFLSQVCIQLGISGEWLLSGRLPMKTEDIPTYVLKRVNPDILMNAMSGVMLDILERLDRAEQPAAASRTEMQLTSTA